MPEPPEGASGGEERGREAEVLRARRDSLERLRARGIEPFALSLRSALGVDEPDRAADVRNAFGDLEPDTITEEVRSIAGRVVLWRPSPDGDLAKDLSRRLHELQAGGARRS